MFGLLKKNNLKVIRINMKQLINYIKQNKIDNLILFLNLHIIPNYSIEIPQYLSIL